jgi:hypothetical protein
MKVKYTDKFVPTDYFTHPKEAISNWYRIKSDSWSYEKEIRIVLTNINLDSSKQVFIPISTASFSTIYLGAKIDSNDESKLRSICSQHLPEVKIYKMHLKKDSFSLSHE